MLLTTETYDTYHDLDVPPRNSFRYILIFSVKRNKFEGNCNYLTVCAVKENLRDLKQKQTK